ncbi:hypothetical protein RBB50_010278 [Rhinocladiella similis]
MSSIVDKLAQSSSEDRTKADMTVVQPSTSEVVGETAVIARPFNLLTSLGVAYSITNSPLGIFLSMGSQVYFGGCPAYLYGYILMAVVGACTAVSLGELSSMYPHAGGQYHFVGRLCPPKSHRFVSYVTAILAWAGAVGSGASSVTVSAQIILGMVRFVHPGFTAQDKPWVVFVVFQAINLLIFPVNCFEKLLPHVARAALLMAVCSAGIIFVSVLAASPSKQSAEFVFADFNNVSGWPTGVAFFIGINNANWSFSCLDAATHLADELPNPRRDIPKTLLYTMLLGFTTGIPCMLALYFSIQSVEDAIDGTSGVFIMELFLQVFSGNKSAALGLESLVLISTLVSIVGIHTWQSRMAWAFSRDKGFPLHKWQSVVSPMPFGTPIAAHAWSASWTALCGCLYLASRTAFSSLISASILLQYISYSIAVVLLLLKGRSNVTPGPFWYPRLGLLCNTVTVTWTILATVFYSLPYFLPVVASEMNYSCVVLFAIFLYALGYWFTVGRASYEVPTDVFYAAN